MTIRVDRSRRSFSIQDGNYQVAPSLRDGVHELGRIPKRADVGERVQACAVAILRYHAGPKAMALRSGFCLPLRETAARCRLTKANLETVMRYLDGELIERVAVPEDRFSKHKTDDGIWHNNAVLWRFSHKWHSALLRLHQASARLSSISDKFKSSSMFSEISVSHLPRRWLAQIRNKYPNLHLSGIAADRLRTVTRNRPAAPPSKLVPSRWTTPQAAPVTVAGPVPESAIKPSMASRLADLIRGAVLPPVAPTPVAPTVVKDINAPGAMDGLPDHSTLDGHLNPKFARALAKRCVEASTIVGARLAAEQPAAKRQMREGERTFCEIGRKTLSERATNHG